MLSNKTKRIFLFLFGCIALRFYFVYLAKTIDNKYLPIMGWLALLPSIGFSLIYTFGLRKTGPEVFGEKIWWNNLRPVHAALYLGFAISAILKKRWSYLFLLADVILGLSVYLIRNLVN